MVESYFLALASFPEPQHATSRIYYAKYLATGLFSDDVIDAYSTEEERKIFTLATERWDASKIDRLPECMIISFKAFKKLCDDFDSYALQHGKPYAIYHQRETWNEYIRSSKIQVDWLTSNELPTFEEYMRNAVMTTGIKTIACAWHLPMKSATEAVYDWVFGNPRILSVLMYFDRLHNDVTSWQFDKERGIATSIDCYMKEYNVSEETAKMKFWEMIEDCWKDLNEEYSRKRIAPITGDILYRFINQARIFSVLYQEKDGFTYSREYMEPFVNQVLLTPFKI